MVGSLELLNIKDKNYYDNLENDAIKEITLIQYQLILNNESIPNIYKIPKYDYFDYIENHINNDFFIKRDFKKFNSYRNQTALNFKYVNDLVYSYTNDLYKFIPLYEDLNIFYLVAGHYSNIIMTIKKEFKISFKEPVIATTPTAGFNAKFTKLHCNEYAILIKRPSVRFLSIMNDLLNIEDSNISSKLDNYFVNSCVSFSLNKFQYLEEEDLNNLEKITLQGRNHFLIEDIALSFIIAHELWHSIIDNTLYKHAIKSIKKIDKDIPDNLIRFGAKWKKELQVDAQAIMTVLSMYNNICSSQIIYNGLCLALIPGLISELNLNSKKAKVQPLSEFRHDIIKTYLKQRMNWEQNSESKNIISNFYFLWEKNKLIIGDKIVNKYKI